MRHFSCGWSELERYCSPAELERLEHDDNLVDMTTPQARADVERWTANIVADQARRKVTQRSSRTLSGRRRLADNQARGAQADRLEVNLISDSPQRHDWQPAIAALRRAGGLAD
jgi:hypothetical protein